MPKFLTEHQVKQYHESGYLAPVDVLPQDEAAMYRDRLEEIEMAYPAELNPDNRNNAHLVFPILDEIAHHKIIIDAVEDLIGGNLLLWGTVLFIKEPDSQQFVSWHQDATYMGLEPHNFVTPWLALTPSNRENGCMCMIPGSHKGPIHAHEDTFHDHNILTRGQSIEGIDESTAVELSLNPGQMSLHHAKIIHGSTPNRSSDRRIGVVMQCFANLECRQTIGENYWMPVRGRCQSKDQVYLQRPRVDMDPVGVENRKAVNQNWSNILYSGASRKRKY